MLKILSCGSSMGRVGMTRHCVCQILADAEEDILALNSEENKVGNIVPAPGSTAETADGSAAYTLSPSSVWTKKQRATVAIGGEGA